jgi:ubiquinone/menaquinone biosynthesis C-methylase UbiE
VFELAGAELRRARAVLDIGCGTGWWLERLSAAEETDGALYGVDLLAARTDVARARVPGAEVIVADARRLPFEDGRFDVVCAFTVLSSMPGPEQATAALSEALRVLAPAGVLLIWEPRLPSPLNRHTRRITRPLLRRALAGCRLEIRSTTLLPPVARRLGRRTDRLYPRLARVPALRSHRLVAARRGD